MELILHGLNCFMSEPIIWLYLIFGVFFGLVFGCIPGLTSTLGISLLIPFTFVLSPAQGMATLIGVYVGGISGGLITAMLINIPGTPSSMVTCWDGYPMGQKGQKGAALSLGIFSSTVGGTISAFALIFIAPPLARLALKFGSWELLSLMLLGMSVVLVMTSDNPIKGGIAALLGITLGMVGIDPISGVSRLTFGMWQLQAGMDVVSLCMAFFAVREVLVQVKGFGKNIGVRLGEITDKIPIIPSRETLKNTGPAFFFGNLYGTLIGILPAVGQTTAAMLAYNSSRQVSKHPKKFGTGIPEGVVASETANNAVNGGALITLLTLGIPGDITTSILIGGLMIHGIRPGPLLFRNEPELMGTIMVIYFLSNIIMFILMLGFLKGFVQISKVPLSILFPIILVTCIVGVYSFNNRFFDLWILIAFGIIGYFLSEWGVSMPPLILGFILGNMIESTFRTAMFSSAGNLLDVINHPIAAIIILITILMTFMPYMSKIKKRFSH